MASSKGLVKAKEYKWQDSNLALFGSDVEKNVKKESASSERAWSSAGKRVGLQIWRIENFKVKAWPRQDYGKFYDGDSYIILNTYRTEDSEEFQYDVHFWIGEHSTQDEYCTAAYKTVELDTYLDDKAVQHREVMTHESALFKTYFEVLTVLKGGVKSGFKNVLPEKYERRLLKVHGTTIRNCEVVEVQLTRSSLNDDDVFILDMGKSLYQWNGKNCDKDEKFKAMQVCQAIKSDRGGKATVESYNQEDMDRDHVFYKMLGDKPGKKGDPDSDYNTFTKTLLRYSVPSGYSKGGQLKEICKGRISAKSLDQNDVFLLDSGRELYIWLGSKASVDEKRTSLEIGHNYLMQTKHPLAAISSFVQGNEPEGFKILFDD